MRFSFLPLVALMLSTSVIAQDHEVAGRPPRPPTEPFVCNPNARGPRLAQLQNDAIHGFANFFLRQQAIKAAYDAYVPGQYIQHNPFSEQGREFAIDFLTRVYASGTIRTSNYTIFSGQNYGILHYRSDRTAQNTSFVVVDYFRFEGDCIVEHWDVSQRIFGNETNPIAFF